MAVAKATTIVSRFMLPKSIRFVALLYTLSLFVGSLVPVHSMLRKHQSLQPQRETTDNNFEKKIIEFKEVCASVGSKGSGDGSSAVFLQMHVTVATACKQNQRL